MEILTFLAPNRSSQSITGFRLLVVVVVAVAVVVVVVAVVVVVVG